MLSDFIWRLEAENGYGPYSGNFADNSENDGIYYGTFHPSPHSSFRKENEIFLDPSFDIKDYIFGFKSIPSARRWWYSQHDLIQWEAKGMCLVAYDSDDIVKYEATNDQVMFIPKENAMMFKAPASHLHLKKINELMSRAQSFFGKEW